MRSARLFDTLVGLYGSKPKTHESLLRTVAIEGPPGGGKTTIVKEVAKSVVSPVDGNKGIEFILIHMPTALVEDFGIPYPNVEKTGFDYMMPHWFPYQGKPGTERGGILLFDDRNQATPDLQKVLANICQERELHGHKLADHWQVISTGNRQEDKAGANRVLSHLRNRETILEYETHLDDWTGWAIEHDVHPSVVSFIRFRPNLLNNFNSQNDQNATPRSWVEGVSDIIGCVPSDAEHEAFGGAVGKGPAAEFVGFLKVYRELPNPDNVFLHPKEAPVPKDPMVLYALAGALAHRATVGNFDALCQYLDRVPPEFSVLTVKYAARKDKEVANSSAFTKWALKHQDVLF